MQLSVSLDPFRWGIHFKVEISLLARLLLALHTQVRAWPLTWALGGISGHRSWLGDLQLGFLMIGLHLSISTPESIEQVLASLTKIESSGA